MRILYFLADPGGIGGASKVMLKQASLMSKAGHEVCVVIQNNAVGWHSADINDVCDDFGLNRKECFFSTAVCVEEIDFVASVSDSQRVREIIESYCPDIVHSLQINTSAEIACRALEIPHLMSIYPLSEGMFNISWNDVFPSFLLTDSEYFCKKWETGLGINAECIRVSYDIPFFSTRELMSSDSCEIVCIGLLTFYKNQLEIIKFVDIAREKGIKIHLSILGYCDNDYGRQCMNYVAEKGLEDSISFKGFIHNIEDYLREADLLIHASMKESYPGVIVEAMANRIPIMVTPVGGIPELVKDCWNGFFIDGFSSKDICETFERFLEYKNSGNLLAVVENGFRTYLENHTGQVISSKLVEYYDWIINRKCFTKDNTVFGKFQKSLKNLLSSGNGYSDYTNNHMWYIWHIKKELVSNGYKTALIWGAGLYGQYALEWCECLSLKTKGFVDSHKKGRYLGYSVFEPDSVTLKSTDVLFIAIADLNTCRILSKRVEEIGLVRNRNFFLLANNPCM